MRRLHLGAPSNGSSDHDDVTGSSIVYDDNDCLLVKGNATSATTCGNRSVLADDRFPPMDYYYYDDDDAGWDFLDIYYSTTRFAVETTMAVLSMTLNVLEHQSLRPKQTTHGKQHKSSEYRNHEFLQTRTVTIAQYFPMR